jgi:hypothetical protein
MLDPVQRQALASIVQETPSSRPRLRIVVSEPLPTCPKCGTERRDQRACPRCGLAGAHMAPFLAALDATVPTSVHSAWRRVREDWRITAHHEELLQLTIQHQCYAWVAAKYREASRERPGDQLADAQIVRLRRASSGPRGRIAG